MPKRAVIVCVVCNCPEFYVLLIIRSNDSTGLRFNWPHNETQTTRRSRDLTAFLISRIHFVLIAWSKHKEGFPLNLAKPALRASSRGANKGSFLRLAIERRGWPGSGLVFLLFAALFTQTKSLEKIFFRTRR